MALQSQCDREISAIHCAAAPYGDLARGTRFAFPGGVLASVLLLQLAASAAQPPPGWYDDEPKDRASPEPRRSREEAVAHGFLLRAGAGVGSLQPSEHAELLAKDGYDLDTRAELTLAASAVVAGRVAIGAYAGVGTGGTAPSSDAPTLTQTVARTGGELSLVLQPSAGSLLLFGPQVGVLQGTLSVHGAGESQTVLEYGGMLGAYFRVNVGRPVWYLGATLAYTLAPAEPPGAVGRDYDYGAFHIELTAVLGG
ncbi:MAG: hypothetical protein DYH12_00715 [Sorangiineae bacterium PRO1]|nr:hypothetical protein [Sorangiineae bacterium PRO1]